MQSDDQSASLVSNPIKARKYRGGPCRVSTAHIEPDGLTVRYVSSKACILCTQINKTRAIPHLNIRRISAWTVIAMNQEEWESGIVRYDDAPKRESVKLQLFADVLRDFHVFGDEVPEIARNRGISVAHVYYILNHAATDVRKRHVYGARDDVPVRLLISDARILWEAGAGLNLIVRTLRAFYPIRMQHVCMWLFGRELGSKEFRFGEKQEDEEQ